ncbi:MAG: YfbU family protein [Nitrosospira sp.]
MKLSSAEKLILIMLSEVYEKLGIEGEIDPAFVKKAILRDHTWGLRWKYDGIFAGSKDDDPPEVNEVTKILTMWRAIEGAYKRLSPEDQEKLKKDAGYFEDDIAFYGFDGNDEAGHFRVATFLITDLGLFDEFKDRDINSHNETLSRYRKMLSMYELSLENLRNRSFNASELLAILAC